MYLLSNPLISVIVPVFNAQDYLRQGIESVISQTYTNWELILVDDGSTDESGSICDEYAQRNSQIKCLHKKNGGLSSARCEGVNAISGTYAMFMDSDDWLEPDTLERCIQIVDEYDADCVCFSYVREYPTASFPVHIYDNSIDFSNQIDAFKRRFWGLYGRELKHPERGDSIVSCCMKLYDSRLLKEGRYFDLQKIGGSEDTLFNIYALNNCLNAYYLDEPLYHYRKQSNESLSNAYRPMLQRQYDTLFHEFENAQEELAIDEKCRQALNNRIMLTIIGVGLNELSNPNKNERKKKIRQYIRSDFYKNGYQNAQKNYLPLVWKIFVFCAGHGWTFPVFIMLQGIRFLKSRV